MPAPEISKYPPAWISPLTRQINPEAIVLCRIALRWSQSDLAQYIGVRRDSVSNWERGRFVPQAQHALLLAEWINVTYKLLKERKLQPPARFYHLMEARLGRTRDETDGEGGAPAA